MHTIICPKCERYTSYAGRYPETLMCICLQLDIRKVAKVAGDYLKNVDFSNHGIAKVIKSAYDKGELFE